MNDTNIISTIFLTPETYTPVRICVKNAIPSSLRGFTWIVEITEVNTELLKNTLGVDFNRVQRGYYLENSKGFIPHMEGDHYALLISIHALPRECLIDMSLDSKIFKIEQAFIPDAKPGCLTHPLLVQQGHDIDRMFYIEKVA